MVALKQKRRRKFGIVSFRGGRG